MPKSRKEGSQAKATRKLAGKSEETSLGNLAERSAEKSSAKKKGTLHQFPSKKAEKSEKSEQAEKPEKRERSRLEERL